MPAAAKRQSWPPDLCPDAGRIEADMAGVDEEADRKARIKCARAYADCGRRHGTEGRLDEAAECLERAVGLHGLWTDCSEACGGIASGLEAAGRAADAVVWYGRAVQYLDRAPRDAQKERKRRKRRSKRAAECVRCWDALASGPSPEAAAGGPFEAADAAAGDDDAARARMHMRMGAVETGRGRHDDAARWYAAALEIEPNNGDAALLAGGALEAGGRWIAAAQWYSAAARGPPRLEGRCAAGCARCAAALHKAGSEVEALRAIEEAAVLDGAYAFECARMYRRRAAELAPVRGTGGGRGSQPQGGGDPDDGDTAAYRRTAGTASDHYGKAILWYTRAGDTARAAAECVRCAVDLARIGMDRKALYAIEEAAKLDASHAFECARMHRREADKMARLAEERRRQRQQQQQQTGSSPAGGGKTGRKGGGAEAASEAERGAGPLPAGRVASAAAYHYGKAVGWYRRAGDARAAAECVKCARALGRLGMPDKALRAIGAAATLDGTYAFECARLHRRRADELAGQKGTVRGPRARRRAAGGKKGADAAGAQAAPGCGAEPATENGAAAEAADLYGEAVAWYRRAGRMDGPVARAADICRECAHCAGVLDRMGLADGALSALEAAAEICGGAYRLECAAYCRRLADALAGAGGAPSKRSRSMHHKALRHYKAAAEAGGPGAARALLDSAMVCMALGRYDDAAGMFGDALEGDGDAERSECVSECRRHALGLAGKGGSLVDAVKCLRMAVSLHPQSGKECADICLEWGGAEHDAGRHDAALACFEAAVAIDGGRAGAAFGAADALAGLGRLDEALARYDEAGARGGDAARAAFGAADALAGLGRYGEAAGRLAGAAEADPQRAGECAERCIRWGRAGHNAGRHDAALACFEAAVAIDGGGPEATFGAADALAGLGRLDEALARYEQAGARGGDAARAAFGAADALAGLGRYGEAAGRLAGAAEADPQRAGECKERCMQWGRAGRDAGRHNEAIACFEAAVSINGDDAGARLGLAESLRMGGRSGDALREYSGARRHGDADQRASAYVGIASIMAVGRRHMDAAGLACMAAAAESGEGGTAAAASARSAECADLCAECGDALQEQERHDGAAACYAMALSIDPRNAGGLCGMGAHKARQGLAADALRHYNLALEADGKMVQVLVGAGRAHMDLAEGMQAAEVRRDHFRQAEAMFERAIGADPRRFEAHMGAGAACLAQKYVDQLEKAESYFCAAASVRSADAGAALLGAGKACRRMARLHAGGRDPQRPDDLHRRAIAHYDLAIEVSRPGSGAATAAGYWKGVCMLHLGDGGAKKFLAGVLERARPTDRDDLRLCGRICDILGDYRTACDY